MLTSEELSEELPGRLAGSVDHTHQVLACPLPRFDEPIQSLRFDPSLRAKVPLHNFVGAHVINITKCLCIVFNKKVSAAFTRLLVATEQASDKSSHINFPAFMSIIYLS